MHRFVRRLLSTKPPRNPSFKKLDQADISHLSSISPCEMQDITLYNQDWMKKYKGSSPLVLFPTSTKQVSQILSYCNLQNIAIVPQSGNTGLVGGSVAVHDEVVLSTTKMSSIRGFDENSGAVSCDSGIILQNLDNWLTERGFCAPLDLGAKGSCTIGGNVSTNAGGLRVLRYGSLHGSVLGLEVVLADGTILDNMSTLRKDNTGIDLKHLFIGSEGTLGVVTGVVLQAVRKNSSVNTAMLAVSSYEAVLSVFSAAKTELNEVFLFFIPDIVCV